MRYSEKLNGYWEEGYHYYIEIRDGNFTIRDYRRRIIFSTTVEYDADSLDSGRRTELHIGETVISKTAMGEPMMYITGMYWDNGEIIMDEHYTIMGDYHYVLHKTDNGPFDHIVILDDTYLDKLKGEWIKWTKDGSKKNSLFITGNDLIFRYDGSNMNIVKIHVISYKTDPDRIYIVNQDLTADNLEGFTNITVYPDMLTGRPIIMDAEVPLSVFARENMLDKITIPPEAQGEIRNTMFRYYDEPFRRESNQASCEDNR